MAITFEKHEGYHQVFRNGEAVMTLELPQGCVDTFQPIGKDAFYWRRKTDAPVDHMKLTIRRKDLPRYFLVPGVNYNGNNWGSGAQYAGYGDKGEPWTYAWHRISIPACTYSESDRFAVALFGEEKGGMSCSIYPDGAQLVQELIWPEVEGPKVLFKRTWEPAFQGTMEPCDTFTGIVMLTDAGKPREKVHRLVDLAWRLNYRQVTMAFPPEKVKRLDQLYIRAMFTKMFCGLVGFKNGVNWSAEQSMFIKHPATFEIGWCGQNAAQSCAMLDEYLEEGHEECLQMAIQTLDSWDENAFLPNGLMYVRLQAKLSDLESVMNGTVPTVLDTCNLGTAATYLFRACDLAKRAGVERPSYARRAYGLCDFFARAQCPNGEFAKSYFVDGSIDAAHGSVGAFVLPPLLEAYTRSGDAKYLDAARKGLDFYLGDFSKNGYTTAGALDSNCVDKESAAPLLRAALRAYEITGEKRYLDASVEVGYYLATWQWHYSMEFPPESRLAKLKFDTYGSTSVSASHNALDHYGIYWIPEYLKLAELTGNEIWAQRARALWYNGIQLLSDGTLVINGHVRPAGSQDESIRNTRWGRPDGNLFVPCDWCTVWQGTFRHLVLEELTDWDILR